MQIGIVGLPFSGKTTLFGTLTNTHIDPDAFQKRDSNISMVKVPDSRLDKLTAIFNPKKKVNATIEFVDLIAIQKGEHSSSQFSSQFLTKVRTNDALIHVVRGFEDDTVPHVEGSINLLRDINTLEEEFLLADMAFVEGRFEKLEKDLRKPKSKDRALKEIEVMKHWQQALENEQPLRAIDISDAEMEYVSNYQPLSAKPMLLALNLGENDIAGSRDIMNKVLAETGDKNIAAEPFFAKIELELAELDDEEKEMFMEEYGIAESALSRLIGKAYELLGLQSFFTVGEDECRAWTIKKGMTAQQSAGVIHTDFYNKFIRAEVASYDDFMEHGSLAACKDKGLLRLEGKEYVVKDGDILNIRHG